MIFQFILNIVAKSVNEVVNMTLLCPIIAQSDPQDCKKPKWSATDFKSGTWMASLGHVPVIFSC